MGREGGKVSSLFILPLFIHIQAPANSKRCYIRRAGCAAVPGDSCGESIYNMHVGPRTALLLSGECIHGLIYIGTWLGISIPTRDESARGWYSEEPTVPYPRTTPHLNQEPHLDSKEAWIAMFVHVVRASEHANIESDFPCVLCTRLPCTKSQINPQSFHQLPRPGPSHPLTPTNNTATRPNSDTSSPARTSPHSRKPRSGTRRCPPPRQTRKRIGLCMCRTNHQLFKALGGRYMVRAMEVCQAGGWSWLPSYRQGSSPGRRWELPRRVGGWRW